MKEEIFTSTEFQQSKEFLVNKKTKNCVLTTQRDLEQRSPQMTWGTYTFADYPEIEVTIPDDYYTAHIDNLSNKKIPFSIAVTALAEKAGGPYERVVLEGLKYEALPDNVIKLFITGGQYYDKAGKRSDLRF